MKITIQPSQHSDNDRSSGELRALDCNLTSLCDHIQIEGFNSGAFSDIVVHAMGSTYHLHRLILSRSPYFRSSSLSSFSKLPNFSPKIVIFVPLLIVIEPFLYAAFGNDLELMIIPWHFFFFLKQFTLFENWCVFLRVLCVDFSSSFYVIIIHPLMEIAPFICRDYVKSKGW